MLTNIILYSLVFGQNNNDLSLFGDTKESTVLLSIIIVIYHFSYPEYSTLPVNEYIFVLTCLWIKNHNDLLLFGGNQKKNNIEEGGQLLSLFLLQLCWILNIACQQIPFCIALSMDKITLIFYCLGEPKKHNMGWGSQGKPWLDRKNPNLLLKSQGIP